MPDYLLEAYLARGLAGEHASRERRARSAAEELAEEGTRVRFGGSFRGELDAPPPNCGF